MHKKIVFLFIISLPALCQAQFGNFMKKVKNSVENKIEQRAESRVGKEVDKALDEVEGNKAASGGGSGPAASSDDGSAKTETKASVKSFSKFDFIPGEKILYSEDFSQDAVGELPLNWNSTGKGEVVTLESRNGKWLRMFQNTTYLAGPRDAFGKDFTVEFDLLLPFKYYQHTFPLVYFGLLSSGDLPPTDNSLLKDLNRFQSANVSLRAAYNYTTSVEMETRVNRQDYFKATDQSIDVANSLYSSVNHVAVQVQKSRLRIWINSQKVFDVPRALDTAHVFNQLYFKIGTSGYRDDAIGFYLTNLKVAAGLPDTRHKLLDEGKFSTTGILFDVNAATIKPESAGVLKEIGTLLKENGEVKVKIIGHTDSDGADAANLELSKKRSEAVKAALVKDYGIDESRLATDGKGETSPVADNKAKEGKAQNRRVEFVKL